MPCCKDAQAVLWRSPQDEGLKPPANSQNQLASHGEDAFLEIYPPAQLSLQITSAKTNQLNCPSVLDLPKLYEILNSYYHLEDSKLGGGGDITHQY